jgi:2-polyprenyl-6-methoxyphenol hydroxylase-like FAD-dependent oxidoreductase
LESASELKEVGAAVMLGPSAVKILEGYGIHLVQEGGVVNTQRSLWTSSGDQVASNPYEPGETPGTGNDHVGGDASNYNHSLINDPTKISIHRVDLHSALLRSATAAGGPGNPCAILLGHRVVQVVSSITY